MRQDAAPFHRKGLEKYRREGLGRVFAEGPSWLYARSKAVVRAALLSWFRRSAYRLMGYRAIADPRKVITIDPRRVERYLPVSSFELAPRYQFGRILGGEWDTAARPLAEHPKYRACRQRVVEGRSWEETGIIDLLYKQLEEGTEDTIEHGCSSREDLVKLYENDREALYRSLRDNGFDRQESEVCCRVHIGRDGALLFGSGGRNRFFLSKELGIENVPVQVLVRHREWQEVRERVQRAVSRGMWDVITTTYSDHPDLREFDLPHRGGCEP